MTAADPDVKVLSAGLAPVTFQQVNADGSGVFFVWWTADDFCRWFVHEKGWLPSDTMRQPVGVLTQIVDDIDHPKAVQQAKAGSRSVVENVTAIETARKAG